MEYKKIAYSFLKLKGKIWESEYAHYLVGIKAFERLDKNNSKILDIGCGAGGLTAIWQDKFPEFKFEGVDLSPKAIGIAKNVYPDIKFKVLTAEKIPSLNKKYEAVSICEVIEHLADPTRIMNSIRKILKKEGILYLTTQLEGDKQTLTGKFFGQKGIKIKEEINGHIQLFSDRSIKQLVRESGFKIVEIYYNCHFLGQIEDLLYTLYLRKNKASVLSYTDFLQYKSGVIYSMGILFMHLVALVRNLEDSFLRRRVGLGIQIIAKKI